MSVSPKDQRVITEVIVIFVLVTFLFHQGAYLIVLGGLYGVLLYDLYNRTSYGERIRERLRKNASDSPSE